MRREDIKSYKDACKCIGRKLRQYKDAHMNTYEQLTTSNGVDAGLFRLRCGASVDYSGADVGTQLRLKEQDDADYLRTNFTDVLFDWFRKKLYY